MTHEILIVDDEPDIRLLIEGILQDEGYETRLAGDADSAIKAFHARRPSLVILDIWLQGSKMDGLEILKLIQNEKPAVPTIMISGHGTIETAVSALQHGAYDFIEKPFKTDHLLVVVRRALEAAKLARENEELRFRSGYEVKLNGQSQTINSVKSQIERVAPTNSRVLIYGAPGTGKEVAARAIHKLSKRAEGPFFVLNCATLSPTRFEEELFGIEGNTQNNLQRRTGVLEKAHGGTLVLDEVADMPLETQGKIVRALQDQTFQRVGGSSRVKVDVRVIAITNKDLNQEIANGRFRKDLYYRLAVVPLKIPSLKERREDIPELATLFLKHYSELTGVPVIELSADALTTLQTYEWPGNVRELRNLMERLLIMMPGNVNEAIRTDMLPSNVGQNAPGLLKIDTQTDIISLPLREARDIFETQYLQAQLMRFGGNISRTAGFVGMERSALHRKLKQLGVTGSEERNNNNINN
ncbi:MULTISPECIES: nitrogen assimilation response regulator NtrX [Commensalibacter]|uniref:nitrogen assimilation response regulator NtrX n=1 Tax=Commensalibacter TaxID=1079922 RepID=UPI0012D9BA79|nr:MULTISPECIES: sigma-54 dependent transcriptional regulator [Commensalibacter]MCT6841520.1 sigma-54 dependent transcriptional regulator [Commensalibacter sp.]MBH9972778.1 sigma-54-dependent Fis family transcriptional regulator [Commensalibacter melissae]MBI0016691.1 sigma-54-dependent Fis family transcriptional regulator [Commensalibacter sp. B14384M2]MBI0018438.1 sigma-54-dependent Fis family transcriptional regulator [Commensalibacter sp. W8133]MBI0049876.1 sigma-54-dependent Fis family tr